MKILKRLGIAIALIILGCIIAINLYSFISVKVLKKDYSSIFGYSVLEVVSGSMEPTINIGDLIIINTLDKEYKKDDIITFKDNSGLLVTHRLVFVDDKSYVTKGDNNNALDEAVSKESYIGKYVTKIPYGGYIISSFRNPFTLVMVLIIGILGCVFISVDSKGNVIPEKDEKEFQEFLDKKEKKENKKKTKKKTTKKTTKKK